MADNSDSDSDFESKHSTLHAYKQVLRPLTAHELQDPNAWPCFLLENARVFDKQGKLASILDVGLRGPFTITGRLSFEGDDGSLRARCMYHNTIYRFYHLQVPISMCQPQHSRRGVEILKSRDFISAC